MFTRNRITCKERGMTLLFKMTTNAYLILNYVMNMPQIWDFRQIIYVDKYFKIMSC